MVAYSAFFSAGLLATKDEDARSTTPTPSSSELAPLSSTDMDITPKASMDQSTASQPQSQGSAAPSRTMRRRRSSINIGANSMASIKCPARNASSALQRARAGSVNDLAPFAINMGVLPPNAGANMGSVAAAGTGVASEDTSLMSRFRSGSMASLGGPRPRPRRVLRRSAAAPTRPPPSVPLPELPSSPNPHKTLPLMLTELGVNTAAPYADIRRPLGSRTSSVDNVDPVIPVGLDDPRALLSIDTKLAAHAPSGLASSPFIAGRTGYFDDMDAVMKEN
ncbi:hypothetical protein CONPUDRAFT_169660 [Coniophora puteana RWD-64-598 SS2]|uniref:Uncharacterized protein n=1 Tax=Coniophora puteana (strain RWD-64-598) TaxID=741705 RepID=A0A5M3M7T5_CONPW|nr:uncharacterized protein CONPUDRAFT_169660 [Coniophora puteana RWD-64-598 SS2]EIW75288.1 hypothetical protein CONPUDRAFT_169660 [Coniophora puteana RWD-64-598 SS2]